MATRFKLGKAAHLRLGRIGEECACRLLAAENCTVLIRNCRLRGGELDVVALDGGILVFVEVKTRRKLDRFRPAANLTPAQERRIRRGAAAYLNSLDYPALRFRFDLIEVIHTGRTLLDLRHHREYLHLDADLPAPPAPRSVRRGVAPAPPAGRSARPCTPAGASRHLFMAGGAAPATPPGACAAPGPFAGAGRHRFMAGGAAPCNPRNGGWLFCGGMG